MSYILKTNLAAKENYGGNRSASTIKYLIFHYTANDGDTDEGNGNYFKNNIIKASAHYFVDDDSVTNSVPDLYVAYAVGGSKWSDTPTTGGGRMYGIINNTNSLSIEMCDTKKDGVIQATEATMQNAILLARTLMEKYSIPISNVYRHFDVNGKHCPAYMMDNKVWEAFKLRISNNNTVTNTPVTENITTSLKIGDIVEFKGGTQYASASANVGSTVKSSLAVVTSVYPKGKHIYHVRAVDSTNHAEYINGVYGWVDASTVSPYSNIEYRVRVTASVLNIRSGPSTSYGVVGSIKDKGTYTIIETMNGWGKLKSRLGWISLAYTTRL